LRSSMQTPCSAQICSGAHGGSVPQSCDKPMYSDYLYTALTVSGWCGWRGLRISTCALVVNATRVVCAGVTWSSEDALPPAPCFCAPTGDTRGRALRPPPGVFPTAGVCGRAGAARDYLPTVPIATGAARARAWQHLRRALRREPREVVGARLHNRHRRVACAGAGGGVGAGL
jgi:hypothetical protein